MDTDVMIDEANRHAEAVYRALCIVADDTNTQAAFRAQHEALGLIAAIDRLKDLLVEAA